MTRKFARSYEGGRELHVVTIEITSEALGCGWIDYHIKKAQEKDACRLSHKFSGNLSTEFEALRTLGFIETDTNTDMLASRDGVSS